VLLLQAQQRPTSSDEDRDDSMILLHGQPQKELEELMLKIFFRSDDDELGFLPRCTQLQDSFVRCNGLKAWPYCSFEGFAFSSRVREALPSSTCSEALPWSTYSEALPWSIQ
jgi:hypothetical protein